MTPPNLPLSTWLRSSKVGQAALFAVGLLMSAGGYFAWQVVGGIVYFFTFGSGEGHKDGALLVEAAFMALHMGLLGAFFRQRVLYSTWGAWALNASLALGLFAHYNFLPWYHAPRQSQQTYGFVQGGRRYHLTLQQPGQWFDLSDVTDQHPGPTSTATTTSLLMGDFVVRHDTVFMREWNGPKQCQMFRHTLLGFQGSPIPLKTQK